MVWAAVPGVMLWAPMLGMVPVSAPEALEKLTPLSTWAAVAAPVACTTEPSTPKRLAPLRMLPAVRSASPATLPLPSW